MYSIDINGDIDIDAKNIVEKAILFVKSHLTFPVRLNTVKYIFSDFMEIDCNRCQNQEDRYSVNLSSLPNGMYIPVEQQKAEIAIDETDIIVINWSKVRKLPPWLIEGIVVHETSHFFDYSAFRQRANGLNTTLKETMDCKIYPILSNQSEVRAKYYQELYLSQNPEYRMFEKFNFFDVNSDSLYDRDYSYAHISALAMCWEYRYGENHADKEKIESLKSSLKARDLGYCQFETQHYELFSLESLNKMWEEQWNTQMVSIETYNRISSIADKLLSGFYRIKEALSGKQIPFELDKALMELERFAEDGAKVRTRFMEFPTGCCVEASFILAQALRTAFKNVECLNAWYGRYSRKLNHVWVRCGEIDVDITYDQFMQEQCKRPLITLCHMFGIDGAQPIGHWKQHQFSIQGQPDVMPMPKKQLLLTNYLLEN
jgi:hypothetical protein